MFLMLGGGRDSFEGEIKIAEIEAIEKNMHSEKEEGGVKASSTSDGTPTYEEQGHIFVHLPQSGREAIIREEESKQNTCVLSPKLSSFIPCIPHKIL